MALTHLLDTSVYSQPVRKQPHERAMRRWSEVGDARICINALVHAELLQGLHERNSETYWRRYRELLENRYLVLPFDAGVAATYANLRAVLRRRGQPKPVVDLMIAATACHHGLVVATLNLRDFTDIPGVRCEDWS